MAWYAARHMGGTSRTFEGSCPPAFSRGSLTSFRRIVVCTVDDRIWVADDEADAIAVGGDIGCKVSRPAAMPQAKRGRRAVMKSLKGLAAV